jgi:hypothetical protein
VTDRARRLVWLGSLLALFGVLALLLRRFVLTAPLDAFRWTRTGIKYELLEPRALAVVLLAPLLLYVLGKSLADLPWQQRVLSVLLRIAFFVLLGLGLSRLVRSDETHRVATVVLLDVSDSVADATLDKARAEVERLYRAKADGDVIKLVAFAARPRAVPLEQADQFSLPKTADLRWKAEPKAPRTESGSNIQAALQLSYGLFPPGYLKRIGGESRQALRRAPLRSSISRSAAGRGCGAGATPARQGRHRSAVRRHGRGIRESRHDGQGAPVPG